MRSLLALFVTLTLSLGVFAQSGYYSVFVATDRHEETNYLKSTVTQANNYVASTYNVTVAKVVHGGDLVNNSNSGSLSSINGEFLSVLTHLTNNDIYYTWGSHDANVSSSGTNGYLVSSGVVDRDMEGAVDLGGQAWLWGIDYNEMTNASTATSGAAVFTAWVDSLASDDVRPIIIMSHVPMHYRRGDNYGATAWLTAINAAAANRDIIFLWGHNHTSSNQNDSDHAYVPVGGSLTPENSTSGGGGSGPHNSTSTDKGAGTAVTIQFTYMNAGYLKTGTHGWRGSTITIDNSFIYIDNYSNTAHYANRIITRKTPVVATTQYTVSATVEPEGCGMVFGTGDYDANATCTLIASPNTGYDFASWTLNDSIVSTNPMLSFTVTSDTNFVAHLVAAELHTITTQPVEHGSISADKAEAYVNEIVTLAAEPDTGYFLSSWDVRDADSLPVEVVNNVFAMPDSDVTVSATFEEGHTITLAPVMNGSISADHTMAMTGYTIYLEATPDTGYTFGQWVVFKSDDISTLVEVNEYNEFVMPPYDVTVSAFFAAPQSGEVTVGSGTSTSNYLPATFNTKYSLSQQIYTSDEIGTAGTISSIAFYKSSTDQGARSRTWVVYVKHTSKDAFDSDTDWETLEATDIVYSGSVSFATSASWITLSLTTPFEYNGTDNLLVAVDDNTGSSYTSNRSFYVYDTDASRALYVTGSSDYDPSNMGSVTGTCVTSNNQLQLVVNGVAPLTTQAVALDAGWNWFSPTVDATDLRDQIEAALDENLLQIYSNDSLPADALVAGQMYKIHTLSNNDLLLVGQATATGSLVITEGANWIGIGGTESIALADLGIEPNEGDKIVSQAEGFAIYEDGAWAGTLTALQPGRGYVYLRE